MEKQMKDGWINPKLALLLGVLGTSFSSILVKYGDAPSLVTAVYRLAWSVIIMLLYVLWKHVDELKEVNIRSLVCCSISGIFLALHFSFWFESLKHTSVASSTVLVSTEVVFSALGFVFFLKGKIPRTGWASIVITLLGSVVIAMADKGSTQGGAVYGDVLALLGAVFVAVYTLIGKTQRRHLSTTIYTFLVYTACLITLVIMAGITRTPLLGYDKKEIWIGLALAVCCTILGHSVYSWCLKYISPAYISSCKLCEPVFATIVAVFIYGEIPKLIQIVGGIIIIGGVLLYSKFEKINAIE